MPRRTQTQCERHETDAMTQQTPICLCCQLSYNKSALLNTGIAFEHKFFEQLVTRSHSQSCAAKETSLGELNALRWQLVRPAAASQRNNSFTRISGCCWRESVACLQLYCHTLPIAYMIDQRKTLFWKKVLICGIQVVRTLAILNKGKAVLVWLFYRSMLLHHLLWVWQTLRILCGGTLWMCRMTNCSCICIFTWFYCVCYGVYSTVLYCCFGIINDNNNSQHQLRLPVMLPASGQSVLWPTGPHPVCPV